MEKHKAKNSLQYIKKTFLIMNTHNPNGEVPNRSLLCKFPF